MQLDRQGEGEGPSSSTQSSNTTVQDDLSAHYDALAAAQQAIIDQFRFSENFPDTMVSYLEKRMEIQNPHKISRVSENKAHNSQGSASPLLASSPPSQ